MLHSSRMLLAITFLNFIGLLTLLETQVVAQEPVQDPASEPTPFVPTLVSKFAADVDPAAVLPEYPRPTLIRPRWLNLNGSWEYAIRPLNESQPKTFDGSILVPFAVESQLSGVGKTVGADNQLWYRRRFQVPSDWRNESGNDRLLLHFGAVDWKCQVWINGQEIGGHQGGYDPFSIDITDALQKTLPTDENRESGADQADQPIWQEIVVSVFDPTDAGPQPRGKQVAKPEGIWYTPVTGIWQTVWLEPVASASIESLHWVPSLANSEIRCTVQTRTASARDEANATELSPSNLSFRISIDHGDVKASFPIDQTATIKLSDVRPWSTTDPFLYEVTVELLQDNTVIDQVRSYFGMRSIELRPDANGFPRLCLNGETLFMFGPLDQGWWPDGLYTAPTDEALKYDLQVTADAGFNLVRKHVKIEPERWYSHCDRMGLIVWQDMPSGDENARWPHDGTELQRTAESKAIYEQELRAMILARRNHPCIVAWVPFNEAWGQFETVRQTEQVRALDPTRLVISASGGNDFGVGDVHDIHNYPGPEAPPSERQRAAVLGEYGGLGLPIAGHTWQDQANWGYRSFSSADELQKNYLEFIQQLRPMIESRLAAAVYTQTTDVEIEVNGLMTYDRAIIKFDLATLKLAHAELYQPLRSLSRVEQSLASTIAYWRFEAGKPGEPVPHNRDDRGGVAARDESGHDNHLYAWAEGNAPKHSAQVSAGIVPLTGTENIGSLDDSQSAGDATKDLYTDPGRSGTHMDVIETFVFKEFTIELSVQRAVEGATGTMLGEDGRPVESLKEAPLQIGLDEAGVLRVVLIDATGKVREVSTKEPLALGEWQHCVIRCDGQQLTLDRVVDGACEREAQAECLGGMIPNVGTWTVGRGFHEGRLGRDGRALLDEIRISTLSLDDELLLWSSKAADQ